MSRDENSSCPTCGSDDVRCYAYGYMLVDNEEEKQEFDKKFVMGGCVISDNSRAFTATPAAEIGKVHRETTR